MSDIKINFISGMFMVPEFFVDKYIKDANPSFIKLYIYILRHANTPFDFNLDKVSQDTGLLRSDVISGLNYWQECGILTYRNSGNDLWININNCLEKENVSVKENTSPSPEISVPEKKSYDCTYNSSSYNSVDIIKKVSSNKKLKNLFSLIEQMLNKSLNPNDYKIIHGFIDYLGFDENLVLYLFEHCVSKGHNNMRYIEKIAMSWSDKGISNISLAQKHVENENRKNELLNKYKRLFRIHDRDFLEVEENYILDWENNLKVSDEILKHALNKSILNTGKITFKYIDAVIRSEIEKNGGKFPGANSKFRNYPDNYEISDVEKAMIDKVMAEYEGGFLNESDE